MPRRLLALICVMFGLVSVHAARQEDDGFSATRLDSCRWFDWSQTSTTSYGDGRNVSTGTGLKLKTDGSLDYSNARVISQYSLPGDASIEVGLAVDAAFHAAIPGNAQKYAAFGLWADETRFVFISLALAGAQPVVRVLRSDFVQGAQRIESVPDIPLATPPTAFRIERAQGVVTLSYEAAGAWRVAARIQAFGGDAYVLLQATAIGARQTFEATFSNFAVTSGETTHRAYVRDPLVRRSDFMRGVIVTDYLNWNVWSDKWQADPFPIATRNGVNWIKANVTTKSSAALAALPASKWNTVPWSDAHWASYEIAAEILKRAKRVGAKTYLEMYLSDESAHAGKQHAPAAWAGKSLAETAQLAKAYATALAQRLKADGVTVDLWGVGNETDFGFIGFATSTGDRFENFPRDVPYDAYLQNQVWPMEATLVTAVIEGIRAVFPEAKTVMHPSGLAHWTPADVFTKAFFKTMIDHGVPFDHAAISLPYADFPWPLDRYTTDCWFQRLQETTDHIARLGKKTIITEGSYPHIDSGWTAKPMPEFPYSPSGQAAWLRELLRFGNNSPNILGFLYWASDYYPGLGDPAATVPAPQYEGLFSAPGVPTPALAEFGAGKASSTTTTDCLFDWAQRSYPGLFPAPAGSTALYGAYSYRFYPGSGTYLGRAGSNVYYLGPASQNALLDLGAASTWLAQAGCQ
jgi:arabinogalactan endo-1,4-beta-galactosidase